MFDLRIHDAAARLTLSRPEARNAIPMEDWALLAERIAEAEESGARLLVVAGSGGAFCAGADLNDFPAMQADPDLRVRFRIEMRGALDRLHGLAIPTIAAIEGPCYGAGVALAMACDIRISGKGARFAITPAKIGISYPQEDVHRLVELVGPGQAARLLFTGHSIDGAEAHRIGLIEIEAGERLDKEVDALASAVAANGSESLATLKQAIRRAAAGARHDPELDRSFDELIGGKELTRRLAERRRLPRQGQ